MFRVGRLLGLWWRSCAFFPLIDVDDRGVLNEVGERCQQGGGMRAKRRRGGGQRDSSVRDVGSRQRAMSTDPKFLLILAMECLALDV